VDTTQLQSRWPDVLEAVRGERKVAWILLTNATVKSLLDGALTVEFAREGDAKGFVSSGCDAVLGSVLQAMFGISPQLKTTVRTPGSGPGGPAGSSGSGGPGTSGPGAPGGAGGAGRTARGGGSGGADGWGAGQAGAGQSGAGQDSRPQGAASWADSSAQPGNAAQPGNSSQAGNAAQATGTASSAAGNAAQAAGTNAGPTWAEPSAAWDDPAPGWDDDPRDDEGDYDAGPSGPPDPRLAGPVGSASGSGPGLGRNSAPGALSGMDLIERELGGRIIQDLGDA
jgi:DNA polymerase-3 subunit gamma/tau